MRLQTIHNSSGRGDNKTHSITFTSGGIFPTFKLKVQEDGSWMWKRKGYTPKWGKPGHGAFANLGSMLTKLHTLLKLSWPNVKFYL